MATAVGLAVTGVASAAAASGDLSVSMGAVHLAPAEGGGYAGVVPVRVAYRGTSSVGVDVIISQPPGIRFGG